MADKPGRKREHALEELRALKDPAAIPALDAILMPGSRDEVALEVISVLGNMHDYAATESLVRHAVHDPRQPVRAATIQQLKQRSARKPR